MSEFERHPEPPTQVIPTRGTADGRTSRKRPVRRPWWLITFTVLVVLLLAGTAVLASYLWRTTESWLAEAERLEAVSNDLAADREALTDELTQVSRDLAATDAQLREAQDRITELADEKARAGDERELARQLATTVARAVAVLEVCVRGQGQLITALEDVEAYDPQSVSDYARQVSEACNQALADTEQIKQELGVE